MRAMAWIVNSGRRSLAGILGMVALVSVAAAPASGQYSVWVTDHYSHGEPSESLVLTNEGQCAIGGAILGGNLFDRFNLAAGPTGMVGFMYGTAGAAKSKMGEIFVVSSTGNITEVGTGSTMFSGELKPSGLAVISWHGK